MKKVILITGCSSGIGYYCAKELNKDKNFKVIASCKEERDVERLNKEGIESIKIDLRSSLSIQEGFNEALKKADGKIYALFNNGAFGQPGAVEDLSRDVLQEQFETNLFGTHELTTIAIKHMREQNEGKIIQNSSVLGFVSLKFRGAYNSSKYALEGLSDTLRLELKGSGIFISIIEPGPIVSNFRQNAKEKFLSNIDYKNSFFKKEYKKSIERFNSDKKDPFTLTEDAVYYYLIKALSAKNPKPRYRVTIPTTLFWFLKRVLSTRALDFILQRL